MSFTSLSGLGVLPRDLVTIACDESGAEGENLMRSQHPVFVHASTDLTPDEADAFMDRLRTVTRSRAPELKSAAVLEPRHREAILPLLADVYTRANINLVEKSFYVSAKLIAILVEEQAQLFGIEVSLSGMGRQYASYLHDHAPRELGEELWLRLLATYNDLIRVYARAGAEPPTTEPFFITLAEARRKALTAEVRHLLDAVWSARHFAFAYEGGRADEMREMDPMFSTLRSVSMAWRLRLGNVPMEFLIDRYSTMTPKMREGIVESARAALSVADVPLPVADLRRMRIVDSREDGRVQVADIIGGVGREIARLAYAGQFDDDLQIVASEMLDFNGMWSDASPLDTLYERRPPEYPRAFLAGKSF